ncbi:Lysozyme RrrD [compost metagenome]
MAGVGGQQAYVATTLTVPSEGFYTHAYDDTGGLKTWCVGHLGKKGEVVKKVFTEDECVALFVNDWVVHERLLNNVVTVPYKSGWMQGALTDFTFNKGIGNVRSSTLLKDLNNKRYDKACTELTKWKYGKVNGIATVLPGLVIRASKQYSYCMGNEPAEYKSDMTKWE